MRKYREDISMGEDKNVYQGEWEVAKKTRKCYALITILHRVYHYELCVLAVNEKDIRGVESREAGKESFLEQS